MTGPTIVRHNRIDLALWALRPGTGRPLLLLHGLGEATSLELFPAAEAWPGPIWGLDFTGHGASTIPVGGGYACEQLMADVDAALAEVGPVTVAGRGLGGYVALLVAGGRPALVRGAVIADGPGLSGGGPAPTAPHLGILAPSTSTPDAYALIELNADPRPPDYARHMVALAVAGSGLDEPIAVAAALRPPWLEEVVAQSGVVETDIATALATYAALD